MCTYCKDSQCQRSQSCSIFNTSIILTQN